MPSLLGEKIRAKRTSMGLSLDELAKRTDTSKGYIWELENRDKPNPSIDKLNKIAVALGLTSEFLLGTQDDSVEASVDVADQAFFRNYQAMNPVAKEKLRKMMEILDGD